MPLFIIILYVGGNSMDTKAFYNLTYGVFVLGAKTGEKINACITNTCVQVASNPTRIAISLLNNNLTCQMVKESKEFTLSVLDNTCSFDLIKNFGLKSGRDFDKFADFPCERTKTGLPFITKSACSLFVCKVVSEEDLGTHTMFIAEVTEAEVLSKNPPLTYADYQNNLKPKNAVNQTKKIVGWRCKICGYEYTGSQLPADFECPLCGHPAEDFEPIYETAADSAEDKSNPPKNEESKMKFYKCKVCGKIITLIEDTGVPTVCCGQDMVELKAGTTDAAVEKHVPIVAANGNIVTVSVGSVAHPMEEKHFIEWICLETSKGFQMKYLKPGAEPKALFVLADGETVVKAYAYCNLHGLWGSE